MQSLVFFDYKLQTFLDKGVRKGFWVTPSELDILRKLYYLRNGD